MAMVSVWSSCDINEDADKFFSGPTHIIELAYATIIVHPV